MSAWVVAALVTITCVVGAAEASARPGQGGPRGGPPTARSFGGHHHPGRFAGPRVHRMHVGPRFHRPHVGPRIHRPPVVHGWRHRPRPHVYVGPRYYRGGCYRWRRVWTPYGWHMRRVDVCRPRIYRHW